MMTDFGDALGRNIFEAIQGGVSKALQEDPEFRDLLAKAIETGCRDAFLNQVGFGEFVQMSISDGVKEAFLERAEGK